MDMDNDIDTNNANSQKIYDLIHDRDLLID